jgi:hypothetical protein
MAKLHLCIFSCDVTPPLGHPLCGGWIEPVRAVDDRLKALGVVLLGAAAPVVLCAIDWCGIRNEAHMAFRKALAEAAHTTPERVAVQSVHPHDAPFADTKAEKLLQEVAMAPTSLDLKFFEKTISSVAAALKKSLAKTTPFSHIGIGQAKVEQVASNRRILGEDGKIKFTRTSATRDPKARDAPEGLIDPWLKTVSFFNETTPLASLTYYATHPMSTYGQGRVSCDFCGLARNARADDDDKIAQLYFTGAAGNVTAGKYNDGDKKNRVVLRDRILSAMRTAGKNTKRLKITDWAWRTASVKFAPRREANFQEKESRAVMQDTKASKAKRNNAAFQLAWLERINTPTQITCLDLGEALIVHLPGEPFIEYQLAAQAMRKDKFVCVAGYGDGGCGYIPTDKAYLEGGYEPTVALASPCEKMLLEAIGGVLK